MSSWTIRGKFKKAVSPKIRIGIFSVEQLELSSVHKGVADCSARGSGYKATVFWIVRTLRFKKLYGTVMRTIETEFDPNRNNIDVIRLVAASLVIFSHSWPLTGNEVDPVTWLSGYRVGGGSLAVMVFFVLSGFLVSKSAIERNIGDYISGRFLRIVPALTVVSIIEVFILGAVLTKMPLMDYFSHPTTLAHLKNGFIFPIEFNLPGVFEGGFYPHVNGSLWTLPVESFLYLCLPILAVCGLLTRRWGGVLLIAILILHIYSSKELGLSDANRGPLVFKGVPAWTLLHYGIFFFFGVIFYIYRASIPISRGAALVAVVVFFGAKGTIIDNYAFCLSISYLTIFLAVGLKEIISVRAIGDLSYGIYITGWPVQKVFIMFMPSASPIVIAAVALPVSALLAYTSWHLIEKPFLILRKRYNKRTIKEPIEAKVTSEPLTGLDVIPK
mgnify:CR=1 FL=1